MFASDSISSSAYATEEILRVLIVGGRARRVLAGGADHRSRCSVVLFFLILSYRETIKEYPTAGGAYMVTRDNFGLLPAQVAGVSLLTDYVLTVAVSTAAGTAALDSAFPALSPTRSPIALVFIAIIAFGNLKGVKESGKIFAVPTYFFIAIMVPAARRRHREAGHGHDLGTDHDGQGHARAPIKQGQRRRRHLLRRRPRRGAARVRLERRRGHRRRGHLQRRDRVQEAGVEERPHARS